MIKKLFYYGLYSLKYEIKRAWIFFGIIAILFIFFSSGLSTNVTSGFKSVKLIDEDNSNLSIKFAEYLAVHNITINPNAVNTLVIPKGFEKDYYDYNATIRSSLFGIGAETINGFQLSMLDEKKRITVDIITSSGDLVIFFVALVLINSMVSHFVTSRLLGKIYFFTNHLNYWTTFLFSHVILIILAAFSVMAGLLPIKQLLLLCILLLGAMLLVFYQRHNIKLIDNIGYVVYAFGFVLLLGKLFGIRNIPLVDLMFDGYSPMVFIDIGLFFLLLFFVARIKMTE